MNFTINKRVLIIGPYGKLGGVKTHVELLTRLFDTSNSEVRVTHGAQLLQILKQRCTYKPDIIIYNLSVYRNIILRNLIIRTILNYSNTKNILHLHGGRFTDINLVNNIWFKKILKFYLNSFQKIFCLTDEQYLSVLHIIQKRKNTRKIYNYVDIPGIKRLDKSNTYLNLLYIGRLHPQKGIREAVNAVRKIRYEKLRFWIIGRGELERELAKIDDKRIVILGPKTGLSKEKYLSRAHVFLLPSYWPEGLPYALLEASAFGLALIGTKVGSVDQIIENEKNGYFVKPGSVDDIVEKINIFIKDRNKALNMGKESRKICIERFSIDKLKKMYDELLNDNPYNLH